MKTCLLSIVILLINLGHAIIIMVMPHSKNTDPLVDCWSVT